MFGADGSGSQFGGLSGRISRAGSRAGASFTNDTTNEAPDKCWASPDICPKCTPASGKSTCDVRKSCNFPATESIYKTATKTVAKKAIQHEHVTNFYCHRIGTGGDNRRCGVCGKFFKPWGCSPRLRSRSEEHTSELQSPCNLVCRLLLEKKKKKKH